jgi:hypothetical protein
MNSFIVAVSAAQQTSNNYNGFWTNFTTTVWYEINCGH